jgi:hypothetical protein
VNAPDTILTGLAILIGVPLGLSLLGFRLLASLTLPPAERLAWSVLAGLAVFLLGASLVNLFVPLSRAAVVLLLVPVAASLTRGAMLRDAATHAVRLLGSVRGALFAAGVATYLVLLLWPLLARPGVIYYDGTANHDGFFWITGAEYLQRFTYLTPVEVSASHPFLNGVRALTGWTPGFGRIGAEAYVAAVASATGQSPLAVYLWASAALYPAWLAAVYLTARAFIAPQFPWPAVLLLGLAQPLFAFFHHNANLPNLLGVIGGAATLLAVVRGAEALGRDRRFPWSWAALGLVSAHGMLVSYPEIAPFIGLPCALALVRAGRRCVRGDDRRQLLGFAAAVAVGACLVNPATTVRAASGFETAFLAGRVNATWANIFSESGASGFVPALLLLSPKAGKELGPAGGWLITAGLVLALAFTWRRAKDRVGLAIAFSGAALLAAYTAGTGFHYGWQKAAQFGAVFLAAALPLGCGQLAGARAGAAPRLALALVAGFFAYGAGVIQLDLQKWSARKQLDREWLDLQTFASSAPVQVDPQTFAQPFFHGMWSTYFLRQAPLVFPDASGENVGYLLNTTATIREATEPARARLVSRAWAEQHAPNVSWLRQSRSYRLLEATSGPFPPPPGR